MKNAPNFIHFVNLLSRTVSPNNYLSFLEVRIWNKPASVSDFYTFTCAALSLDSSCGASHWNRRGDLRKWPQFTATPDNFSILYFGKHKWRLQRVIGAVWTLQSSDWWHGGGYCTAVIALPTPVTFHLLPFLTLMKRHHHVIATMLQPGKKKASFWHFQFLFYKPHNAITHSKQCQWKIFPKWSECGSLEREQTNI